MNASQPTSHRTIKRLLLASVYLVGAPSFVHADSSTPLLASYYDRHLAVCAGAAHEWTGHGTPQRVMNDVIQVGVGSDTSYALQTDGRLLAWDSDVRQAQLLLEGVRQFAAGSSGVLAIKSDGSLWRIERSGGQLQGRHRVDVAPTAKGVRAASVGDGTNYYVTTGGDLFARGNANRGQYGDGRLESSAEYRKVATHVFDIRSHTGHAILRTTSGEVQGTGGNIYGPVGSIGLGDKAVHWGKILDGASGVATGASHSLAIRADNSLWIWGRNESPEPRRVLDDVIGAAAGSNSSIALTQDGSLWQWRTGKPPVRVFSCRP